MSPADEASAALDALIARCADKVRMVGRAHRLDPAEVDEVFQDVRIRVWTAVASNERIAQLPASYVYRTAESVALDFIRRRRARRDDSTGSFDQGRDIEDAAVQAAEQLEASELGDAIESALAELIVSRRAVVRMYLEGYGSGEIGTLMGWTEPRARNLVYRGLADLREALSRRGIGPEGNRMNDDELRKAYQARHPRASDPEASPEELQRLMAREGPDDERLGILDRALSSPRGPRDLELLRAIAQAGRPDRPRRWWRSPVPLALAASLLLVAVGLLSRRDRGREETRATPTDGAPVLVEPSTDARVAAGTVHFVWQAVPGAVTYRVELLSDAGTLVASIDARDTTAQYGVPRAAGGDSTYRWVVVALLPEGVEVASRPRRIIIKAP